MLGSVVLEQQQLHHLTAVVILIDGCACIRFVFLGGGGGRINTDQLCCRDYNNQNDPRCATETLLLLPIRYAHYRDAPCGRDYCDGMVLARFECE